MNAEIITVGTELLLGDILNSNSQFLSRELAAYGIQLLYQSTVGDNTARLKRVLSLALERSELVLITGGLGPTPDDLTRETVCELLGLPLVLHEESWRRIEEYFASTGREMTENNRKQAMLPAGCIVFPNDHGTAPGCAIERDGRVIILLPGPPKELIPMFQSYVAPYLSHFSGGTIFSQTVGIFGVPESAVAERVADLLAGANPTVAPYAKDGEVTLRVTAHAESAEAARALCAPVVAAIRERLGANVYGVDSGSLQKAVVDLLRAKGKKIATAESCTAGMLSGRLTEVAGASAVFECGIAAYSAEIKHQVLGVSAELLQKYGAVSPEVASAMAVGARRVGQADLGVGITGVAGPDTSEGKPVGTVYIALADEKRTWVKKIVAGHSSQDREYVRYIATSHALDLVRRYLEALPGVMAGGELLEPVAAPVPVIPVAPKSANSRRFLATLFPWKGDTRSQRWRKIIAWAAVLIFLVAGTLLTWHYVLLPQSNRVLMNKLADLYTADVSDGALNTFSPEDFPPGMSARFYGLYSMNSDVAGWIKIDDTHINYPVMQDPGDEYYRTHNFEKKASRFGVPFFDRSTALVSPDSVNRATVIYGNNNQDDQSFSELMRYYSSMEFLETHPLIEMNTLYHDRQWKIFAVMIVDGRENSFTYAGVPLSSDEDVLAFTQDIRDRSLYDVPVDVEASDDLLLLSTPANVELGFPGAELVVAARAVREGESTAADMSGLTRNRDVIMPPMWYTVQPDYTPPVQTPTTTAAESTAPSGELTTQPETSVSVTGDVTTDRTAGTSATTKEEERSTTTSTSRTTTTTSATTATTTTTTDSTVPPSASAEPPDTTIYDPVQPESVYLRNFCVKDGTGEVLTASNKEELQAILSRFVLLEMGNERCITNSTAAIEAQAVASYTHVLYYCQNDSPIYEQPNLPALDLSNPHHQAVYEAVGRVAGVKLLDLTKTNPAEAPICTMYFSASPGVTANNRNVFGADHPYLRSVPSLWDTESIIKKYNGGKDYPYQSTFTLSRADFEAKLKAAFGGGSVMAISYVPKDNEPLIYAVSWDSQPGKYVKDTNVRYTLSGGQTAVLTGKKMREVVNTAAEGTPTVNMRSHCFYVKEYDADTGMMTFQVYGNGHGVGMSQFGAIGYANEPYGTDEDGNPLYWTYDEILAHYYSVTENSAHQIVAPYWG